MLNPAPNFLVIGAQKCATGWMHHHLSRHPSIYMPQAKELEFFSYRAHLEEPGFRAYCKAFSGAGTATAIGEATPSYFWTHSDSLWCNMPQGFQTDIPRVVHKLLGPDTRLILILRNPAERALSAWAHHVAHGEISPTAGFAEALPYGGVADMGFYARHLANWNRYFDLSNFLVFSLEQDIIHQADATMKKAYHFLATDPTVALPEHQDGIIFPGTRRMKDEGQAVQFFAPDHHADQAIPVNGPNMNELRELKELYRSDVGDLDLMLGGHFSRLWGY